MWHPGTVEHIPMDGAGAEGEDQKIPADHGEAFARVIRHAQTKVLGLTGVRDAVPKGRVEGPESAKMLPWHPHRAGHLVAIVCLFYRPIIMS